MRRPVANLIAIAERSGGFADTPPGCVDDETESELALYGYAIGQSDRLWVGGYRIYSPESIKAGNYRLHVPRSIFTCSASPYAHVPEACDFNAEAVIADRGELRTN
jgi:hypothetical protein